jgi:hypothetical protein
MWLSFICLRAVVCSEIQHWRILIFLCSHKCFATVVWLPVWILGLLLSCRWRMDDLVRPVAARCNAGAVHEAGCWGASTQSEQVTSTGQEEHQESWVIQLVEGRGGVGGGLEGATLVDGFWCPARIALPLLKLHLFDFFVKQVHLYPGFCE